MERAAARLRNRPIVSELIVDLWWQNKALWHPAEIKALQFPAKVSVNLNKSIYECALTCRACVCGMQSCRNLTWSWTSINNILRVGKDEDKYRLIDNWQDLFGFHSQSPEHGYKHVVCSLDLHEWWSVRCPRFWTKSGLRCFTLKAFRCLHIKADVKQEGQNMLSFIHGS